jgi:hypothetical protein
MIRYYPREAVVKVELYGAFRLLSAVHDFFNPFASITLAGMQYTGSRSTSPGYPKSESPANMTCK